MTANQANYLGQALHDLVGPPNDGGVAFVRCIPAELISSLMAQRSFKIPGWRVFAVSGTRSKEVDRVIAADQAVEIRESKGPATLLLVDVQTAGAGMDGIYSAAKEVPESAFFNKAISHARKSLTRPTAALADEAVRRASKLGQRHSVSPWRTFLFYAHCAESADGIGAAIAELGLWPTVFGPAPSLADISKSALLVERLLLPPASLKAPSARIAALMLQGETADQRTALEELLRETGGTAPDEVVRKVVERPRLWLNSIKPAFATDKLSRIELVEWRNRADKMTAWSKLHLREGEALPRLILDKNSDDTVLVVRWNTHPDGIAKGAVNYEVSIKADSDVLATRRTEQREKAPQEVKFSLEDFENFEELDETATFQAKVIVTAEDVPEVEPGESEDFVVAFGHDTDEKNHQGSGVTVRCVVEGAIALGTHEELAALCAARADHNRFLSDSKGYIVVRPGAETRSFRVFRPPLFKEIEEDWAKNGDAVGRWTLRVRADGTPVSGPTSQPFERGDCPEDKWSRLCKASRLFCEEAMEGPGVLSRLYLHEDSTASRLVEYLIAWEDVLSMGSASLVLAHTLELQDVGGRTIGLIVLPSHPVRVAWQAAYDALAIHARYECGLSATAVRDALKALDSSHFPSMLPGLVQGGSFVFADTLGVTAAAMVLDTDREPKAAVAKMARCMGAEVPEIAPSVGYQTAEVLAKEVNSYLECHTLNRLLHLHALRPGDGATVVRALGLALKQEAPTEGDEPSELGLRPLAFSLDLYPSSAQQAVTGHFLTRLSERRRSGGGIEREDAWVLDPLQCGGNRSMPRLRWSRRDSPLPKEPAHLSMAFDTFVSRAVADERPFESSPLHAFGLVAGLERRFSFSGRSPTWEAWVSPERDGAKHPVARILTDRLNRLHAAVLRAVAASLGRPKGWPLLRTELTHEDVEALGALHRLSDWVVTVDRNAGVEYFDSPREAQAVYDTYVIDAVPERDDLGCLQMITSTMRLDEVRGLLDQALGLMGISSSRRNCEFLLRELKALSGRLAVRLASGTTEQHARASSELVALALARAQCFHAESSDPCWLSLKEGFLVPLDDVRDLLVPEMKSAEEAEPPATRADLLYVTTQGRGGLIFRFIEVKYRRHLALARSLDLVESVSSQVSNSMSHWQDRYFAKGVPGVVRALRRSRLVRALRFYLLKAGRHHLALETQARLSQELDRMLRDPDDYEPVAIEQANRGFIFCPEFTQPNPERLFPEVSEDTAVFLFGPAVLPDLTRSPLADPPSEPAPPEAEPQTGPVEDTPAPIDKVDDGHAGVATATAQPVACATQAGRIVLGEAIGSNTLVHWSTDIKGNPHLMIVGLPGMGKTTCLVNLCQQLYGLGVTPVVFSYHDDIDEKLLALFRDLAQSDCQRLGFNPMRVTDAGPLGYIESAGLLRDIFSAVFPELGDLQLEAIREAVKASYRQCGWGAKTDQAPLSPPPFRAFFEKLQSSGQSDSRTKGLLARLTELDDYGFFSDSGAGESPLAETRPTILQVHKTKNASVQSAYASFAFYRIYQDMFRRGRQDRITHAVIFDEAHRASRLKLIPTMAKECRKYGIALVLASQEARDFDTSLYSAIANYLVLRVTENDAKALARNVAPSDTERRIADRLKQIEKYQALYFSEGRRAPVHIRLLEHA